MWMNHLEHPASHEEVFCYLLVTGKLSEDTVNKSPFELIEDKGDFVTGTALQQEGQACYICA